MNAQERILERELKQVRMFEPGYGARVGKAGLRIVPIELGELNEIVLAHHRHHKPVQGHRFSIGVADAKGKLVGACSIGRPVARMCDQRTTVEVTRLVTDGTPNACSALYSAAARAAREMGYLKIQTYILDSESGVSLKAAGWTFMGTTGSGKGWQSREGRRTDQPTCTKGRWEKVLNEP